jgi:hypothetical protein
MGRGLFYSNNDILRRMQAGQNNQFGSVTSETTGQQRPQTSLLDQVPSVVGAYKAGQKMKGMGEQALNSPMGQNLGAYYNGDPQGLSNFLGQQGWFGYNPSDQGALAGSYGKAVPGSMDSVTQGYSPASYNPNINPRFESQFGSPSAGGVYGSFDSIDPTIPTDFAKTGNMYTSLGGSDGMSAFSGGEASGLLGDSTGAMAGDLFDGGANTVPKGAGGFGQMASLAGLGLSAYDIANSGLNAGNALGLVGSGLGTAAAFSTNPALMAMGPWGWGLAGLGTVGSLMDWW